MNFFFIVVKEENTQPLPEEKPKSKVSSKKIDDQESTAGEKDSKEAKPQTSPEEKPKSNVSSKKIDDQESTKDKKDSKDEKSPGFIEKSKKVLGLYHPKEGKEEFVLDENLYRQTADNIKTELNGIREKINELNVTWKQQLDNNRFQDKLNVEKDNLLECKSDFQRLYSDYEKLQQDHDLYKEGHEEYQQKKLDQVQELEQKLEDSQKLSNNVKNIIELSISEISKEKIDAPVVNKIIDNCENKISQAFYALFLLERLKESETLGEKYPEQFSKVFKYDFEGNIAQLISLNICEAKKAEELDDDEIKELINYTNSKLKEWEILSIGEKEAYSDKTQVSTGVANAASTIQEIFTLPVKIADQTTQHTDVKRALVSAK